MRMNMRILFTYYTIEKGVTHFYASKVKLYVDDHEKEEKEIPIESYN